MKKNSFKIVLLFSTVLLTNCGSEKKSAENSSNTIINEHYECPMKCTEEVFDKQGKCPVCEMDLVQISNG